MKEVIKKEEIEIIDCHINFFGTECSKVVKRRFKEGYKTKIINTICCEKDLDRILCTIIFEKEVLE
mgnify:CR=1 FL=1